MRQQNQKILTTAMIVLLVAASFFAGYRLHHGSTPTFAYALTAGTVDNKVSLAPVSLISEVLNRVQQEYVEPIDKPEELTYSAVRGMLASLNDPYTRFMDPKQYAEFNSDNQGHFAGIGATLNMVEVPAMKQPSGEGTVAPVKCPVCNTVISDVKHYRVAVVEPLKDSPAMKAGLKAKDVILKVDGKPTDGLMIDEVTDMIRGQVGTKVTLTIARKDEEKPVDIPIIRQEINVDATESKMLDGQIGYLRLLSFNEKTYQETRAALIDFQDRKARGIVLDLRNNPGGLMMECVKIASLFLPAENKKILSTKGRDGVDQPEMRIGNQICTLPVVVLTNKGSASASEILTGALKDYKRATIVGETTFGKALVQTVIPVASRKAAIAITTAHYYTPSGFDLAKLGIKPDITVALDKDATALNEKDNQALEAIKVLKGKIGN